jgi:hypothetical protein
MNTGEFEKSRNDEMIIFLFPMVMVFFVYTGSTIVNKLVREDNEDKIMWMLDL